MIRKYVVLAACLPPLLVGCPPAPAPMPPDGSDGASPTPPRPPIIDGAPAPLSDVRPAPLPPWNASDVCGSAYSRAVALGCSPVQSEAGSWDAVCRVNRAHGLLFFDVGCTEKATTRAAVAACGITCRVP